MVQSRRSCSGTHRQVQRQQHSRRLRIEVMEDRRLLAVVTVDTELDVIDLGDGVTSLREAIFAANTVPGPDEIVFTSCGTESDNTGIRGVLESAGRSCGPDEMRPAQGWTDLFLYPPAKFGWVDAMITNFHLPRSTLLMLVAAFCSPGQTQGREMILNAYAEARAEKYRFYSYGDAMLIE